MRMVSRASQSHRGATLLLVLGLCAGLAVIAVLFFSFLRQETRHARHQLQAGSASQITELALQEALAKLQEGFAAVDAPPGEVRASMTAAPGLMEILRYDVPYNRGTETGAAAFAMPQENRPFFRDPFARTYSRKPANPQWIPLYSRRWFAPGTPFLGLNTAGEPELPNPDYNPSALFNLNTPHNPFRPGEYYLSGAATAPAFPRREKNAAGHFPVVGEEDAFSFRSSEPSTDRPLYVQWLPVFEDPTKPAGPDNKMIGRYAYWIDVENTKVHLHRASRPWREHPAFALVGDADALGNGSGSFFEQSANNPARRLRREVEALLPGPDGRIDGSALPPAPSLVGASLRSLWLDWWNGEAPAAADNSLVDWEYFEAGRPRPPAWSEDLSFADLLSSRVALGEEGEFAPLQHPEEALSLLDPALAERGEGFTRQMQAAFQRTLANALTTYGYEEERDPLGRPKIDLVKFLRTHRAAAGAGGNPDLFRSSELWTRLRDPNYHRAYDPGLVASGGRAQGFLRSLNRFGGTGNPARDANGEAAALQMLVNMVEYTLPATQPPLIDETRGLVGHRSIPYVAEVVTRARSALWLLPEADLLDLDKLLERDAEGNFTYTHNGRDLAYYTSHVLIEVALGFLNPDPFASRAFSGTVTLNYTWSSLPPGAQVTPGPQTKPLQGLYTAHAEGGKDEPKTMQVTGDAVVFSLGVVPAQALWEKTYATALRITGWEIRDASGLWHKVPVRHPGSANAPVPWWAMAQNTRNVGFFESLLDEKGKEKTSGENTLARYQLDSDLHGFRAVGWFTVPTKKEGQEHLRNHLEMMRWDEGFDPSLQDEPLQRLRNFIGSLRWRAVYESVYALDPALGHRTGATDARPEYDTTLRGHFYGTTGHVWRHGGTHGKAESGEDQGKDNKGEESPEDTEEDDTTTIVGPSTPSSPTSPPPGDFSNLRTAPVRGVYRVGDLLTVTTDTAAWAGRRAHGIGYREMTGNLPYLRATTQTGTELQSLVADVGPGGLLRHFQALQLDRFPLDKRDFKIKDDGKWLDELAKKRGDLPEGHKAAKVERDSHVETLAVPKLSESKALKTDSDQLHGKALRGIHAGAPRGAMMTSIGEIGFVHSGFPNLPILLTEAHGTNEFLLNSPQNGPPMRMLLDLFTPGAFVHPETGERISRSAWETGVTPSHSPSSPRVGTWNINASPAHESYLVIRQGAHGLEEELKKEFNPASLPARVLWHPAAGGWRRNAFGNEHAFSKKLAEIDRKIPGEPLDRLASPFASRPRGWSAWIAAVGGDFSPSRATGQGAWSPFSPGYNTFAPGMFTWTAGRGVARSEPFYQTALANLGPDDSLHSRLLTFGSDGRKELELHSDGTIKKENERDGYLRGRFTADEWLDFQNLTGSAHTAPRHFAPRFAVFPLRHRISDLALNYNYGAELRHFATALNPRISAHPPVLKSDGRLDEKFSDYNHFPGSHAASGLFLNAPLVLLANQASTSANAFTIHIVAQTIRDDGEARPGVPNSGPGHSDPDDTILAERWTRIVVEKERPTSAGDTTPRLRILRRDSH
jgi:hypothetical protein